MIEIITPAEYKAYARGVSRGAKMKNVKTPRAKSPGEESLARQLDDAGIKYQREWKFHPNRKWKFDFIISFTRIAIEVEGSIWQKSRHTSPIGYANDLEKYNEAAIYQWSILRFSTDMVKDGRALKTIMKAIA